MAEPCITRVNQSAYLIASHKPLLRNSTMKEDSFKNSSIIWIYDFSFNNWLDLSSEFPCGNLIRERIMCSNYNNTHVIIPTFPKSKAVCTAILNLKNFQWSLMNHDTEPLFEKSQENVIFNPIDNKNGVVLINAKNVYLFKRSENHFHWEFQWEMNININSSSFVCPSEYFVCQVTYYCPEENFVQYTSWTQDNMITTCSLAQFHYKSQTLTSNIKCLECLFTHIWDSLICLSL